MVDVRSSLLDRPQPPPPPPERLTPAALRPWIETVFDRSAGPGGQNVNKLNTRAAVLFDFAACPLFSHEEKKRIAQRLHTRMSYDDRVRIVSQNERTQLANREAAMARLIELLEKAIFVPRERRPTRPTFGSQRRRMDDKRRRSDVKRDRRPPRDG